MNMSYEQRLGSQNFEKLCGLFDPVFREFPLCQSLSLKIELETFLSEEDALFRRGFDDPGKPNHYEGFLPFLLDKQPAFRGYLEKRRNDIRNTEQNWLNFLRFDPENRNKLLRMFQYNVNSARGQPIQSFMAEEILIQLENINKKSELGTNIDFLRLNPREMRCFKWILNQLLSQLAKSSANARQTEPRVMNNTIMINNSVVLNTRPNPILNIANPRVFSTNMAPTSQRNIQNANPIAKKPINEENFWDSMVNMAENPVLNDTVIRETVKKRSEKRKSENILKEPELAKKVKKDEPGTNPKPKEKGIIVVGKSFGVGGFLEAFKDLLVKYEEGFKDNITKNMEKHRMTGFSFSAKRALVENGLAIKILNGLEAKLEHGALKILIYPNTIIINDCKALKEMEICFDSQTQDLGIVIEKWQKFQQI